MSSRQKTGLMEVSGHAHTISSVHLPPAANKSAAPSRNPSPVSSLARRTGRTRTRDVVFDIPHTTGKFDLMKACGALQLETTGTVGQLRTRIQNYINGNYKLEHYMLKEMRSWWLSHNASDPKKTKREWIQPGASEKIIFQGVRGKDRHLDKSGMAAGTASVAMKKGPELAPPVAELSLKEDTFDRIVLLPDDDDKSDTTTLASPGVESASPEAESTESVSEEDHDTTITLDRHVGNETFEIGSPTGTIQLQWEPLRTGDDNFSLDGAVNVTSPASNSGSGASAHQEPAPNYGHENGFINPLVAFETTDVSVSWKEFEQHRLSHTAEMNELTMMLKVLADEMRDIDDVLLEQSAEILHNKAEINQLEKLANSACSATADHRNILYTAAQQIEQFQRESLQYTKSKQAGCFVPQQRNGFVRPVFGGPPIGAPTSPRYHSDNFMQLKARFQGLQRTTADALETVKRNHKRLNVTIAGIQMTEGVSPTEDADAILERLNFKPGCPYAAWRRYGEREDGVPFDPSQPPFLIIRFNSEFIVMDLLKTFNAFRNRFPDRKAPFKIMKDLTKNQVLEAKKVNEIILQWRKTDGRDYRNRDGVIYLFENGVRVRRILPGEGPLSNNKPQSATQQSPIQQSPIQQSATQQSATHSYVNRPYSTSLSPAQSPSHVQPASTHPGSFARALPPPPSQTNTPQTLKRYDTTTNYDYGNTRPAPHPMFNYNQAPMAYHQLSPQHPQQMGVGYHNNNFRQPIGLWYPPGAAMLPGGFR
ncbi:hypothetical protein BJ508DRAFT_333503 [Ascobolus immersus RN42]|uniref:Uncharacterized protein n=1 Tax=Ascobolus immersus RN42 TaxID=1160509 RepID=A0A3N4HJK0_ASCIM|nr:hypothetical protein BJ508DRAFT_333503 [Ascobolus immersus RN42]